MRALGIDLGDVRTGVAISDESLIIARSLETISNKSYEEIILRLSEIINEYKVDLIVIGFPKNMNGTVGDRGEKTKIFAEMVSQKLNIKTVLWDERLTTVSAHRVLSEANVRGKKRKKAVDPLSAVFILQGYLDSLK